MRHSSATNFLRPTILGGLSVLGLLVALTALAEDDGGYTGDNPAVTTGPDVTVWSIASTSNFGSSTVMIDGSPVEVRAYSVSSDSCNIGSEELNWCDEVGGCGFNSTTQADHPVIAQNLYRLKDGRFKQLGKSWVKHGFLSLNSFRGTACTGNDGTGQATTCVGNAGNGGDSLRVGCTDLYGSGLNGNQFSQGPRIDVEPTTGVHPASDSQSGSGGTLGQRVQVRQSDLVADADGYWVEIHYVGADDAQYKPPGPGAIAVNGLNNASYSPVTLGAAPSYSLSFPGTPADITQREAAAIWAWKAADPAVELVNADVLSSDDILERFHVARKVTVNTARGVPTWHYEVVVHNMNSDREANALSLQFPANTAIANAGFYDVDWHSGEENCRSNLDWIATIDEVAGTIRWAVDPTVEMGPCPSPQVKSANSIPWSTSFNFWFDSNAPATSGSWTLELAKAGTPTEIAIPFGQDIIFVDGFESGDAGAWAP